MIWQLVKIYRRDSFSSLVRSSFILEAKNIERKEKCCFTYHASRSHGSWSHSPRVLEKLLRIFISWRWEMYNFIIAFRPSFVSCFMDLVILLLLTTNFYLKNLNTCRIEVSISHFRIYDIFKLGWCILYM